MRLNVADINECIEGTSDCSADAVCNNIQGSYNKLSTPFLRVKKRWGGGEGFPIESVTLHFTEVN